MNDQGITKSVKKYKLVFIGDQSVGKTSIITRFIYDSYSGAKQPTVGIDFVAKTLHMDNKTIRLQLWDTAGQERFRSLIPSYIRDSDAAIIVYDVTSNQIVEPQGFNLCFELGPPTFASVTRWLDYVREERGEGVLVVMLANKIDMTEGRVVTTQEAQQFAKEQSIHYHEVSAKDGTNINEIFKYVAQLLQGSDKSEASEFDIKANDERKNPQNGGGAAIQLSTTPVTGANDKNSKKSLCQC